MAAACIGQPACVVRASTDVYGNPCPQGVKRWLEFSYRWVVRASLRLVQSCGRCAQAMALLSRRRMTARQAGQLSAVCLPTLKIRLPAAAAAAAAHAFRDWGHWG